MSKTKFWLEIIKRREEIVDLDVGNDLKQMQMHTRT